MAGIKNTIQNLLKNITPSETEMKKIEAIINFSKETLNSEFKKRAIKAEAFVGGSVAKGTWIKNQHDIDMFVKFDMEYKDKDIGKILGEVVRSMFPKAELLHGTRDYHKVNYKGYEIEFVPVLGVASPAEATNSMDASLFHVDYIRNKIKERSDLIKQIRIFKTFAKAQGIYGAETHISGLSGYVVELLMVHYKTFENLVNSMEDIRPPVYIDIENHYKTVSDIKSSLEKPKLHSPIIIIDPVFKQRNASAALEQKVFSNMVLALRSFSRKPSLSYFKPKKITLDTIKKISKQRGTLLVTKTIIKKYPKEDIFLAKLKKRLEKVDVELEREGIEVYEHGYIIDDKSIKIFFEIETLKLSKFKKHYGPPVWIDKDNYNAFVRKYKNVYVDNINLVTDVKRKSTNIKEIVTDYLNKELKKLD